MPAGIWIVQIFSSFNKTFIIDLNFWKTLTNLKYRNGVETNKSLSYKFTELQVHRAVQWHCAKRAEAHFWAEAPEIIP